ncbi:MAG: hypothetical protein HYZ27_03455 [Deltaproteobacteria bacterium]|nr:hypothetical protein [Deltaproteobacteria bacterium]
MRQAVLLLAALVHGTPARAQAPCPKAADLPQLTIDDIRDPAVPVIDHWQVFWDQVPLSDAQLAVLARDDLLIERTHQEMERRGTWVYIGMLTAAVGAATSSAGWVLFGQDKVRQSVTLSMGLGGLLVGGSGVLMVTESIQKPLEPHTAPTPRHRLSRDEARALVARVNQKLYERVCQAAAESAVSESHP